MEDLPEDEYESYAPRVVALFREGAEDYKVASYLSDVERDTIGVKPTAPEELIPVVRRVRAEWSTVDEAG